MDSTGRYKVEADFIELADGSVRLNRRDGTTVDVPLARLSQADRTWIEEELDRRVSSKEASKTTSSEAVQGEFTTAILAVTGPADSQRITVLPGSNLWVELVEKPSGMALREVMLLKPGSLLFIGEGGIQRNSLPEAARADASTESGKADLTLKYVGADLTGAKSALGSARFRGPLPLQAANKPAEHPSLEADRIYEVSDSGRIQPSDKYTAIVRFPCEKILRSTADSSDTSTGKVESNADVRLVHAASEVDGWHKVRTLSNPPAEGWVLGPWTSVTFVKKTDANT